MNSPIISPLPGEVEEAKKHPNGWVYRIAGQFSPTDRVPPEAIIGAWQVDGRGKIKGEFIYNNNYDPERWPAWVPPNDISPCEKSRPSDDY